MIPWVRSRPWLGDLGLAAVVLAAELPRTGSVKSLLITLACAGLVALGRRHPVPVVALGAAAVSAIQNVDSLTAHPPTGVTVALFPMIPVTAGYVVGLRASAW
ncbi:hypothetical protein ACIBEJ_08295 [Nonomuraea sp. NPDC050790]|uniref:hypothetical protein n=1 Tax=Nonomuraea sp. NPDC050790 TaxID=3364371 RepID=UPI0037A6020B